MTASSDAPRAPTAEERQTARLALLTLGTLGSGSLLGVAFSLYLVNEAPLVLIGLSPLGRHLMLVAPIVDPVAFMLVAVGRRMLFYGASYTLGRALGPFGIVWLEANAKGFARFVRWLERLFARAGSLVVLFMVGPTVCALAGISGMRPLVFAALATTGTTLRMLLILGFAEWMREYIEVALAWIAEYRLPGTVVMVLCVLTYRLLRRKPVKVMED